MFLSILTIWLTLLPLCTGKNVTVLDLPACAINCSIAKLSYTSCLATNQTCLCADSVFAAQVQDCILLQCSSRDALTAARESSIICNLPVRDNSTIFRVINSIFVATSLIAVCLRFYSRCLGYTKFGFDDLLLGTTSVVDCCLYAVNIKFVEIGRDIWTLEFSQIKRSLFSFWIGEILYVLEIALCKVVLLLFYLRVFGDHKIRYIAWGTMAFVMAVAIAYISAGCAFCQPLSYAWTRWDSEVKGHCFDSNILAFSHAAINIACNFFIIALPISQVHSLNLSRRKKVAVTVMFLIGGFDVVISIVRLSSLVRFRATLNPTWDYFGATVWSSIEVQVGIICVCLPAIRQVFIHVGGRIGSTQGEPIFMSTYIRKRRLQKQSKGHGIWQSNAQSIPNELTDSSASYGRVYSTHNVGADSSGGVVQ